MSEIKLIFIRHGEAENAWGHHADPGLSEKGLSQAKNLINHKNLSNLEDYCFISSPKSRAKETAIPLARKFKKNIVYDETFIEIPSANVPLNKKQSWLKKILSTKKDPPFLSKMDPDSELPKHRFTEIRSDDDQL